MEKFDDGPIRGEIVEASPSPTRRVTAIAIALAPLLIRLALWWRERSRRLELPSRAGPRLIERTDLRLSKRPLGRWKLRVVTTRWVPDEAPEQARRAERGFTSPVLGRLTLLALDRLSRSGAQSGPLAPPRLPPGSSPPE